MPYLLKPTWLGPAHYSDTVKNWDIKLIDCYPITYISDLWGTEEWEKNYIPNHYETTFKVK